MEITVLAIGGLLFLSLFFSWVFDRFNIPDVLPLFLIGLLVGPLFGFVDPNSFKAFGEIFAIVTLSIILFEAGLHVKLSSLFESAGRATALIFLNLIATIAVVAPLSKLLFGVSYMMGLAVGTILAGTSATVIVPMLINLKIKEETKTFLKLESSLNNIIVIVLVLGVFGAIEAGSLNIGAIAGELVSSLAISVAVGLVAAFIWSQIMSAMRGIQKSMFTTPAFLLILFGAAELIGGNGAMTVFAFGITLGNIQGLQLSSFKVFKPLKDFTLTSKEETFFSSLVFLVKTYFFVFIGLSINLQNLEYILWGAVMAAGLFGIRALIVNLFLGGTMPDYDLKVVKTMIPKGLTEAALITLIGNQFLNSVAYPVIMFSIIFTSIITFYLQNQSDKKDLEEREVEEGIEEEIPEEYPGHKSFHKPPNFNGA